MDAKKTKKPPKEPKKETKTETSKESDEEFLKRFARMREEASKKASEKISSYSKEIEEFRATGRQAAKDLEEIEECKKIVEEFEVSPPIMETVHVNGVLFEYSCEDSNVAKKIELLKKHGFSFLSATKGTSTSTVNFKTFGKAYIRRGMQKIPLPESSEPLTISESATGMGGGRALDPKNLNFILKDGDILGTERGGYIYDVKDVTEDSENVSNDIMIFPESELRISIRTDITHPEPASMDPSQVPEAIKRSSSSTVNTDTIEKVELIKGLFKVRFLRKGKNINNVIELPSSYPRVEFRAGLELVAKYVEEMSAKAQKSNPKIVEMLASHLTKLSTRMRTQSGICDDMAAFIEMTDGSLVLFGTPNNIVHKDAGKETKKIDPRKKITITGSALYETDCSKNQDPRVDAITKLSTAIMTYHGFLASKKIDVDMMIPSKEKLEENDKKVREDYQQSLKTAEELGDDELIKMVKLQMKTFEDYVRKDRAKELEEMKINVIKAKEMSDKMFVESKRQVETPLPPYNPPSESDKV